MLQPCLITIPLNEITSFAWGTIVASLGASLIIWIAERGKKKASLTHFPQPAPKPACDITSTAHALFPRFSATLIHDLKQPISAIQFNALAALRFLQASESGGHPSVQESLEDIKSDVARLSRLAQGLGAFLGVERGQNEALDVNFEIETALSLLKGEMMKRQIKCQTEFGPINPDFIWKRPILSRTVLALTLNLMDALESSADKAKQLSISTSAQSDGLIKMVFSAACFSTKPAMNLQSCQRDINQRGGYLTDSFAEMGTQTINLLLPFSHVSEP